MDIFRSSASGLQEALDGAWRDITEIGSRLKGTAVQEAFDEADHGDSGKLAILQEGSLVFAETLSAVVTVPAADIMVLAALCDNTEIAGGEAVETRAIRVRTGEAVQDFG